MLRIWPLFESCYTAFALCGVAVCIAHIVAHANLAQPLRIDCPDATAFSRNVTYYVFVPVLKSHYVWASTAARVVV
jgi:hypothetical protein